MAIGPEQRPDWGRKLPQPRQAVMRPFQPFGLLLRSSKSDRSAQVEAVATTRCLRRSGCARKAARCLLHARLGCITKESRYVVGPARAACARGDP
jgi:hypothetical protein